jgi:hypothetical protein
MGINRNVNQHPRGFPLVTSMFGSNSLTMNSVTTLMTSHTGKTFPLVTSMFGSNRAMDLQHQPVTPRHGACHWNTHAWQRFEQSKGVKTQQHSSSAQYLPKTECMVPLPCCRYAGPLHLTIATWAVSRRPCQLSIVLSTGWMPPIAVMSLAH